MLVEDNKECLGLGVFEDIVGDEGDDVGAMLGSNVSLLSDGDIVTVADGVGPMEGDKEDTPARHFVAFAIPFGGDTTEPYGRENGMSWDSRARRLESYFYQRLRMSAGAFATLFEKVLPLFSNPGDGMVGRPPTIEPHIKMLVVIFWLGQGGSQLLCGEAADVADSTFSPIQFEKAQALLRALPEPSFSGAQAGQAAVAQRLFEDLDCLIQKVAGAFIGCLIQISNPLAKFKAAFDTRKCFYGVKKIATVFSTKRLL